MKRREFLRQVTWGLPLVGGVGCAESNKTPTDSRLPVPPDASMATGGLDLGVGVPIHQTLTAGWRIQRDREDAAFDPAVDDTAWESATLPHTARVEALVTGAPGSATYQWQGTAWYRLRLTLPPEAEGRRVFLHFEGAMNVAEVWLDGARLGEHLGGYLPFGFDISSYRAGEHVLAVRLDNRDNPVTGPKPLSQLDFNTYGGLYRDVRVSIKARLHITDPIIENKPGSGGIFVTYPAVSAQEATVAVQVHVRNSDVARRAFAVRATLLDAQGQAAVLGTSALVELDPGGATEVTQALTLTSPALWSPLTPNLYVLRAEVLDGDQVIDVESTRIGIRRIEITAEGFRINGQPLLLRGTNRHQEYPYIGYALSAAAQYRDAQKIKEGGFDYVRLSHYPHDTSFLAACDELGLVVMNCIPGWQYFNADPAFAEVQYDNCRNLLRRDRNHPSVILWEVSLNETDMPAEFVSRTHAIAHEEYPGDQCYTCGWTEGYDVFIQARQHGGCRGIVGRSCLVSEYGDWEYYAANAGLDQVGWANLTPDDQNSRQLRWHGERRLLQQATNFQEAHSGNRQTIAFADGLWVMFDYNRGYAPDIESSGCMDLFRLPKLSYYFFQSQRDAVENYSQTRSGGMVFIASFWTPTSPLAVRVFSNCEAVELYLNGALVERRTPDQDRITVGVSHPPFTFTLSAFAAGTLEAVAFIGASEVARHLVRTPSLPQKLTLWIDEGGRPFAAEGKDAVIVHADVRDEADTLVPDAWHNVHFGVTGAAVLVGANPFSSDGGIASIVLQADTAGALAAVYAIALVNPGGTIALLSAAIGAGGNPPGAYDIHITIDGTAPSDQSPLYETPVTTTRLRAALYVNGTRIIDADSDTPLFRVEGSRAPT
jgi:beta-galactosidase